MCIRDRFIDTADEPVDEVPLIVNAYGLGNAIGISGISLVLAAVSYTHLLQIKIYLLPVGLFDLAIMARIAVFITLLVIFEYTYLPAKRSIWGPEHHIDFYFSSFNTMKIGLSNGIIESELIDILNTSTACKYLK